MKMNEVVIDNVSLETNSPGRVAVIGRGPYGVVMFDALLRRGVDVVMGVRAGTAPTKSVVLIHPDSSITRKLTKTDSVKSRVVSVSAAISTADIIILSIPCKAQASFISGNADALKRRGVEKMNTDRNGIIIVDTSNSTERNKDISIAEKLQLSLLTAGVNVEGEKPIASVVKAFNTVSAYAIGQSASLRGSSDAAPICGDSEQAKEVVKVIGSTIGLRPFDIGPLSCARDMELLGFSFFSKWGRTGILLAAIYSFFIVYGAVWYMILDFPAFGRPAYDWGQPVLVVNKALANTAVVLLAATYLPGKLANFLQLYKRSARVLFPPWLSSWLQIRKQMGLTAVFLVVLHFILTAYIKTGAYGFILPFGNANVQHHNRAMNILKEVVLLLGVLAFVALFPVAMSSLPSISMGMTWREWGCIQRTIGHTALLLSGLHAGCYFLTLYACTYPSDSINGPATFATSCEYVVPILSSYPAHLPPPASISSFLAITVCIFWIILSIPCVERRTWAIRSGAAAKHPKVNTTEQA